MPNYLIKYLLHVKVFINFHRIFYIEIRTYSSQRHNNLKNTKIDHQKIQFLDNPKSNSSLATPTSSVANNKSCEQGGKRKNLTVQFLHLLATRKHDEENIHRRPAPYNEQKQAHARMHRRVRTAATANKCWLRTACTRCSEACLCVCNGIRNGV